jgi:hypothetical protein
LCLPKTVPLETKIGGIVFGRHKAWDKSDDRVLFRATAANQFTAFNLTVTFFNVGYIEIMSAAGARQQFKELVLH